MHDQANIITRLRINAIGARFQHGMGNQVINSKKIPNFTRVFIELFFRDMPIRVLNRRKQPVRNQMIFFTTRLDRLINPFELVLGIADWLCRFFSQG